MIGFQIAPMRPRNSLSLEALQNHAQEISTRQSDCNQLIRSTGKVQCRVPAPAAGNLERDLAEASSGRIVTARLAELQVGADLQPR